MSETRRELEGDWLHGVFGVFREELVSLSADFGQRVKNEIDAVADVQGIHPPSATSLLTTVAMETTNMAASLFRRDEDDEDDEDDGDDGDDGNDEDDEDDEGRED